MEAVKNIFIKEQEMDFWTSLTDEQKADIEAGISEISEGKSIEYKSFMQKFLEQKQKNMTYIKK